MENNLASHLLKALVCLFLYLESNHAIVLWKKVSKFFAFITNLRRAAKLLYIFLTTPNEVGKYVLSTSSDNCIHCYNVEILNLFDPELRLINTNPMIKNMSRELLSESKKFQVQTILVLDYKKKNDRKIFHSNAKLIACDSDIDESFKFMHQSIMTKIKNYFCKDWIVLDVIIKHHIKVFEC